MKVNCNNNVSFVLTKAGAAVWNKRFDDLAGYALKLPPKSKEGDKVTAQLHDVMHVFGPDMRMGGDVPFLDLSLDITPDGEPKLLGARQLRDEFAMVALTGAVGHWFRTPKEAARLAYAFADAMLEARNANR